MGSASKPFARRTCNVSVGTSHHVSVASTRSPLLRSDERRKNRPARCSGYLAEQGGKKEYSCGHTRRRACKGKNICVWHSCIIGRSNGLVPPDSRLSFASTDPRAIFTRIDMARRNSPRATPNNVVSSIQPPSPPRPASKIFTHS